LEQLSKKLFNGSKIARQGWNGKGMHLELATGTLAFVTSQASKAVDVEPFIVMFTADKKYVPWLASHTDVLATDFVVVS
jgi:hypothetical protein